MKKIILLLMLIAATITTSAQQTSLVIDNQTPGWLSSKINYEDQISVKNLSVTGFLNSEDFKFIGTLLNHNLTGKLNLSNVTIVKDDNESDNELISEVFRLKEDAKLNCLELPTALTKIDIYWGYDFKNKFTIDTLVIGSAKMPTIPLGSVYHNDLSELIIREGVERFDQSPTLPYKNIPLKNISSPFTDIRGIKLPTTMKSIPYGFLAKCTTIQGINFPDSLEEIGEFAFANTKFLPETLYMPKELKSFHFNTFCKALPKILYLPKNVTKISNREYYDNNSGNSWSPSNAGYRPIVIDETMEIHIKSTQVPTLVIPSESNLAKDAFNNCTFFVPSNLVDKYKSTLYYKNATINAEKEITNIYLNNQTEFYVGDKYQLSASYEPMDATDNIIKWSCNSNIISVTEDGKLNCYKYGKATIKASTSYNTINKDIEIHVYEHTTGVELNKKELEMSVGNVTELIATTLPLNTSDGKVSWTSSNEEIATVDNNGKVTAHKAGSCTITCTTNDRHYKETCKIIVTQPVSSIELDYKEYTFYGIGKTLQLNANILPSNATNKEIVWNSSDNSVCIVSNGLVVSLAKGASTIKATTVDGSHVATCSITVIQPVEGISLDKTSLELNKIGESIQLIATIIPDDANNKSINWKSSDEKVCIVSNGKVVAVGFGTAVVIATTVDGGFMATCSVTVENTTGIEDLQEKKSAKYSIFTVDGKHIESLQKGINLIRFDNGQTKKVTVK